MIDFRAELLKLKGQIAKNAIKILVGCSFGLSLSCLAGLFYMWNFLMNPNIGYVNIYTVSEAPKIKAVEDENDKALIDMTKDICARLDKIDDDSVSEVSKLKAEFDKKAKDIEARKIAERNKLLRDASRKIQLEKGLNIVLGVNTVLAGGVDVTDDVVNKLK